jgi:4a-hydroxytetrahydrobiopterin dehydratase
MEKEALSAAEVKTRLKDLPNWKQEGKALVRVQTFPEYKDALDFVYQVGLAAEKANHHPDITMNFKRVTVQYWTHTARGISALDFLMAGVVEDLVERFYKPKSALHKS